MTVDKVIALFRDHPGIALSRQMVSMLVEEIEWLRKEDRRLQKHASLGQASAHVLIEAGIVPGINPPCRCDECRLVALEMDDAGYLANVQDRWWEVRAVR